MGEIVKLPLIHVVTLTLLIAALACGLTSSSATSSSQSPNATAVFTPAPAPIPPSSTPVPSPTPAPSATPVPTPFPTPTPVEGPGYGGHYIDPVDNIVYVYLVNPSPEAVRQITITHLAPSVYEGTKKIRDVRALQANYTFRQLVMWQYHLHNSGIWAIPELTMTDVNEGTNRLEYGIDCEHNRDRVQQEIHDLLSQENIPLDAVRVKVQGRVQLDGPTKYACAPREVIDPSTGVSSPGFGGLFWEQGATGSRTLNVYLLEPSRQEAEDLALQVVGHESLGRVSRVRALQGKYTWEQLLEWYRLIKSDGLDIQGADLIPDFMEDRNRLIVEINPDRNPKVEAEVEDVLEQLEVPLEAVMFEEK